MTTTSIRKRNKFTHFSEHALQRIKERTRMSESKIARKIDTAKAVDIGDEPGLNRKHWLFYSLYDDSCFVAIQDSITGLVITVLTIEYHERIAWKIDADHILTAKGRNSKKITNTGVKIIYIKARYKSNNKFKVKTLYKLNACDYGYDLKEVTVSNSFEADIKRACERNKIEIDQVLQVVLTMGNNGEPMFIDWKYYYAKII